MKRSKLRLDDLERGDRVNIVTANHDQVGRFQRLIRRSDGRWYVVIRQRDGAIVHVPSTAIKEILPA